MTEETYKIGMLLISTSRERNWQNIKESYLYKIFLKSFLLTMDEIFQYIIYIGIDKGDHLLDNEEQQAFITKFSTVFKNITFKFVVFDKTIKKGHVGKMWNIVHKKAYEENCDYFFQCGDDILFKTSGWIKRSIEMLKKHNNIGLTGPINNNPRILTQSFVSRKHMEIFGWYFPEEIPNWGIDDWYNYVYQPNYFYPLAEHFCSNNGGKPRYAVNDEEDFFIVSSKEEFGEKLQKLRARSFQLAQKHKILIKNYIEKLPEKDKPPLRTKEQLEQKKTINVFEKKPVKRFEVKKNPKNDNFISETTMKVEDWNRIYKILYGIEL